MTFPEGRERNRAMGVYAAMSISGAAVGLIAGGLLVNYIDWRWLLFVNVPIGALVLALAPRSIGLGALVYGLSNAATDSHGVSHWGDLKVMISLVAAVVLLVSFGFIEARSRHALVPVRVLRSRVGGPGYHRHHGC